LIQWLKINLLKTLSNFAGKNIGDHYCQFNCFNPNQLFCLAVTPMVVQYKRSDYRHQFSIQGEATEKELEALLQRFQELLHPEPGLQVKVVLDCSDYQGRSRENPASPKGGES